MRSIHCNNSLRKIKEKIDPRSFYLNEQGLNWIKNEATQWVVAGCCPFHQDTSPGSFYIHLESGAFNCFSCGAKGGDIISFMQRKYDLSFREVLEKLSCEWGIR